MKEDSETLAIDESLSAEDVAKQQILSIRWAEFLCILLLISIIQQDFRQLTPWLFLIHFVCCLVSFFTGQKSSSLPDNDENRVTPLNLPKVKGSLLPIWQKISASQKSFNDV